MSDNPYDDTDGGYEYDNKKTDSHISGGCVITGRVGDTGLRIGWVGECGNHIW
jgi:hypothetical protein